MWLIFALLLLSGHQVLAQNGTETSDCPSNQVLNDLSGSLTFEDTTTSYSVCSWSIEVDQGKLIVFNFDSLNLPNDCNVYMKVYDGLSDFTNQYLGGNICGTTLPGSFESTTNVVTITYTTFGGNANGYGFGISYTTTDDCLDTEFRCFDGTCIDSAMECDGMDNCGDFSDEMECAQPNTENSECGKNNFVSNFGPRPRIVGGFYSDIWPWQVQVASECSATRCGGTIVGERWILTAASCLSRAHSTRFSVQQLEQIFSQAVYYHPDFNEYDILSGNDVAMVLLEKSLTFNENIRPICLPAQDDPLPAAGTLCVAVGRGTINPDVTNFYGFSLLQVRIPIQESETCLGSLNNLHVLQGTLNQTATPGNQFCAGGDGRGFCDGDYGGPLICLLDGVTWFQVGIGSYGLCGREATFFTKVASYKDWIDGYLGMDLVASTQCGESFTSESGRLSPPNWLVLQSSTYGVECQWTITVPDTKLIVIEFEALYFTQIGDSACNSNYLRVYDGPTEASPLYLGRGFCGSSPPRDFIGSTNSAFIEYKTFGLLYNYISRRKTGFQLSWRSEDKCATTEFQCFDGACIGTDLVCDGNFDCSDSSDEVSCPIDAGTTSCGKPQIPPEFKWHQRIVGGNEVVNGSWPWHVLLVDAFFNYDNSFFNLDTLCSGTILAENLILTSAHCVNNFISNPQGLRVLAGKFNILANETHEQVREVDEVLQHPSYNSVTLVNNIALVHLSEPLVFSDNIDAVCIQENVDHVGTTCVATGWGFETRQSYEYVQPPTHNLRQVILPVQDRETCQTAYTEVFGTNRVLPESQLCAGKKYVGGGVGECKGDTGGPLVCFVDQKWVQLGVISVGHALGCGVEGRLGFYANVSSYIPWVNDYIAGTSTTTTEPEPDEMATEVDAVTMDACNGGSTITSESSAINFDSSLFNSTFLYCEWRIEVPQGQLINFQFNTFDVKAGEFFTSFDCQSHYLSVSESFVNTSSNQAVKNYCSLNLPRNFESATNTLTLRYSSSPSINSFSQFGKFDVQWSTVDDCAATEFRCKSGTCIPSEEKCNNVNDCEDNSDEIECVFDPTTPDAGYAECGKTGIAPTFGPSPRIIGGSPAEFGTWPWHVKIGLYRCTPTGICSGSILSERWILTSASCVADVDPTRLFVNYGSTFSSFLLVASVHVHQDFNEGDVKSGNDIALLQLRDELTFTEDVRPVCLPSQGQDLSASGVICIASGVPEGNFLFSPFGSTISPFLDHVRLPLIDDASCLNVLNSINTLQGVSNITTFPSNQFCAGDLLGGVGACDADYGGPLVCAIDLAWVQVGLGSYGLCGLPDQPTFFTKLANYIDWIENIQNTTPDPTPSTNLCGGDSTDPSGAIFSPNYPLSTYPISVICQWTITVAEERIQLNFIDFDLLNSLFSGSCLHYVAIYEGTEVTASNLIKLSCGENSTATESIFSESSSVTVVFNASIPVTPFGSTFTSAKGFRLNYVGVGATTATTTATPTTNETTTVSNETATTPATEDATTTTPATEDTSTTTPATEETTTTTPATTTASTTTPATTTVADTLDSRVTVELGSTAINIRIAEIPESLERQINRECTLTINVNDIDYFVECAILPSNLLITGLERLTFYSISLSLSDGDVLVESIRIIVTASQCTRSCNNGACILSDADGQETCVCMSGFALETSDTTSDQGSLTCFDIDECETVTCQENSYCQNIAGGFECICDNGFELDILGSCSIANCTAAFSSICENGGFCVPGLIPTCECTPSYTGPFCETELDPCLSFPCQNFGTCNNLGSGVFSCTCLSTFTGDTCSEDVNECEAATNDCQENSECVNTVGSYECNCNTGFRGDGRVRCYRVRLYSYGEEEGDTMLPIGDDVRSQTINLPFPMPFGERTYSVMHVISNGLISVGPGSSFVRYLYQPWGEGFGLFQFPLIAPFWDDFHPNEGNTGRVFYQVYDTMSTTLTTEGEALIASVASRIGDGFNPRFVLKVTWSEVEMHYWYYNQGFPSTFQAIVATDYSNTYLIYLYKEDAMLWETDRRWYFSNNALIGYTNGGRLEHVEYQGEYRPDSIPQQGGTENGVYVFFVSPTISNETSSIAQAECSRWYLNEVDQNHNITVNLTCPCTPIQALIDPRYRISVDFWLYIVEAYYESWCPGCYRTADTSEWRNDEAPRGNCFQLVNSPEGPRCCYGNAETELSPWWGWWWNGALLTGPFGSRYERYQIPVREDDPFFAWVWSRDEDRFQQQYNQSLENDLIPRRQCCIDSQSPSHCELYKELRPSASCEGYVPRVPAWNFGDPHITTSDGVTYTFNGLGEYHHISSETFKLQARTKRVEKEDGTDSDATSFVAFAAQDSTSGVVQFEIDFNNVTGKGVIIKIDGVVQTDLNPDVPQTVAEITATSESGRYMATFQNSANQLSVTAQDFILTLGFTGDDELRGGDARGLLGVWDGDQTNDFTNADGTILDLETLRVTENTDILQGTFIERDVYAFGQTWKVSEEDSIFVYSGTNGDTYADHNPTNPSEPAFLEELVAAQRDDGGFADILDGCTSGEVISTTCLYDTLTTNRTEIGKNTMTDNSMSDGNSRSNANTPPTLTLDATDDIESGDTLLAMVNMSYTLTFTSADADNDAITFILSPDNMVPGATIDATSGDVTFAPTTADNIITSQSNFSLTILATDANNGTTMLSVNIKLCVCQNAGGCMYEENILGSSNYQIVGCECTEAWTGDDCSEDLNGCLLAACFNNVTCTDNVAPETGETCGDCPPGTTGDGRNCTNIDYCADEPCEHICDGIYMGFVCSCNEGFQVAASDNTTCEDVDECLTGACDNVPYTTCANTVGSFTCECNAGFVMNSETLSCDDVNECLEDLTNNCTVETSTCVNAVGTFTCACKQNYTRPAGASPFSECIDLNECDLGIDNCNRQTQTCFNLEPFYECQCRSGYTEVNGACQDTQECQDPNSCSGAGEICVELVGSFRCDCAAGYTSSDGACVNINECLSPDSCEANTECIDTVGAYYCRCQPGSLCVVNPYIGPVTVLVTTDNSLLVLIDSGWVYESYQVELTSSGGSTTHDSSSPTILIESLNPNTEYVVRARVTKLKGLAMIYSNTEYSSPVNATTDAITLPLVITIDTTFEPHLSDLTHPDTLAFINLHHDVLANGLSVQHGGNQVTINGLNFVQFVSGSVVASAEASLNTDDATATDAVISAGGLNAATYTRVAALTKPSAPTNLAVSGQTGTTNLSLSFDPVANARSYEVEASCGSNTMFTSTTSTTVTVTNLPSGGVCSFRVRSLAGTDGVAYSDYSSPLIRSTNPSISQLIINNIQETSFAVTFDALDRGIDYTVSITDQVPIVLLHSTHVNGILSIGVTGLTQGTTYVVDVVGTANDIDGNVVSTEIASVNVTTTDVDECETATCINAVCVNTIGSYMCDCNEGFLVNVNTGICTGNCQSGYCLNGATCINTVTLVPICTCPSGYEGSRCENLALSTILGIVFGILGGILLVVIIVTVVRCYKKNESVNLSHNKL